MDTQLKFEALDELILPKRFIKAEFDQNTNSIMRQIGEEFLTNFDHYYRQGEAPAFFGPPGIGKTHVSAVIAKQLHDVGIPVMWCNTVQVINKLMDYKDLRQAYHYFELKRKLQSIPVIVMDDFGQLSEYRRTKEVFFEVIDARYANVLPTIFTANLDVSENVDSWDHISNRIGAALVRRIRLMSKGLLFVAREVEEVIS